MLDLKRSAFIVALGVAIAGTSAPAFAQRFQDGFAPSRAQALHDCSGTAKSYPETTWGNREIDQYRACMMQHRQPE